MKKLFHSMSRADFRFFGLIISTLVAFSILSVAIVKSMTVLQLFNNIFISMLTGVVSGYVANSIYRRLEDQKRLSLIKDKLSNFAGEYEVYDWTNLEKPNACYKVSISLDDKNGILIVSQTGTEDAHTLDGEVKINDLTFTYGEGNYAHPKKKGTPTGRIQIYLSSDGKINVDKYFLDDSSYIPGFEKWQWRKKA